MNRELKNDALWIAKQAIEAVKPDAAVRRALENVELRGKVYLVSVGKAAWQMANAAQKVLGGRIESGIVLTKYGHVQGEIENVRCLEAGHPVPDENSYAGTRAVLELTGGLSEEDTVLFLLSGGGSALFELPKIANDEMQDITGQMLACGAQIQEMNTIRKRLSNVKGGRFAQWCAPAHVESIVLSDVLGDPLDMIASGPAAADTTTAEQAAAIAEKYGLRLSEAARRCLKEETPKELKNVRTQIIGSVRELCRAAEAACAALGYQTVFLTDLLSCEASEAGRMMAAILRSHAAEEGKLAFLMGGETVVHLKGNGLGGRNQELALAAAEGLDGLERAAVISVGSDGTDGPTDAAGGYVDGFSASELERKGVRLSEALAQNDAYHALAAIDALVMTGPTGTNVNDVTIGLLR